MNLTSNKSLHPWKLVHKGKRTERKRNLSMKTKKKRRSQSLKRLWMTQTLNCTVAIYDNK